jgi:Arc/MetJ-type ribon-helix-helix transcriptional regulator
VKRVRACLTIIGGSRALWRNWRLKKRYAILTFRGVMEIRLTADQRAFVREAIEAGRIHGEEDAVKQALSLWEEQERRRLEILSAVNKAEASLARGEGRTIATRGQVTQLADDIKSRGLARLASEHSKR